MTLPPSTPLSYLNTAGPAADPITRLGWGLGGISVAVMLIIAVLVLAAIFRSRRSSTIDSPPTKGLLPNGPHEGLAWIYVGTGISSLVLLGCTIWTLATLSAIASPGATPPISLEVRAYQYWWRVRYLDTKGNILFTTANEFHVPVGVPVRTNIEAADVIHSFWIPQLGGRMDAIPGQTNVTWFQANKLGRFRGQCGEYCGFQHAHMSLFVDVDSAQQFADWSDHQRSPAHADVSNASKTGVQTGAPLFEDKCGGCHTVKGTKAAGVAGPDLSHLMSRQTIAAGILPNTAEGLGEWIGHTQTIKPGSEMPQVPLTPPELKEVVSYLERLQ